MKQLIQFKQTPIFLTTLALLCVALSPAARAVVPPPDGGYPGFSTAEGTNALLSLTSGAGNTGVGWSSLSSVSTGSFNTGVGAGTLALNTAESNTATGAAALFLNTTGTVNTANGTAALVNNSSGSANSAFGAFALTNNIEGNGNTAAGANALFHNNGGNNTAVGDSALVFNTSGSNNTAVGFQSLLNNATGDNNTAIGNGALPNSTGSGSIAIGSQAGAFVGSSNNVIAIGSPGDDVDESCFIGNIRGRQTSKDDAITVVIDSTGMLGTVSSSRRFKDEIKPMDRASESILALEPVTFRYKSAKKGIPQFGLIAEEVARVNPDLVVRDKNGEIYTVRYEAVNAMLLNEFLKEHRTVQELKSAAATQEANIARQQKQIETLTAGLQKVSAQLAAASPSLVADSKAANSP